MEVDYIEMAILELEKRNGISAAFARTMYNGMKSRIAQLEPAQKSVHLTASGAGGHEQNSLQSSFIADDSSAKHGGK